MRELRRRWRGSCECGTGSLTRSGGPKGRSFRLYPVFLRRFAPPDRVGDPVRTQALLAQQFLHFFLPDYFDSQFFGFLELGSGIVAGHDVICFLAD